MEIGAKYTNETWLIPSQSVGLAADDHKRLLSTGASRKRYRR